MLIRRLVLVSLLWSIVALLRLDAQQPLAHERDLGADAREVVRARSGILYYATNLEIQGFDPRDGRTFSVVSGVVSQPALSPAGDRMAYARWDSTRILIWTVRLNPATGLPAGPPRRLSVRQGRSPEFSPDGRHVAFTVLPATDTLVTPRIVSVPVTGGPELVLARESGWAFPLRWSPDGKWIYYHHGNRGTHTLRRVAATGGRSEVLAPGGAIIGFSPDGRWLARLPPFPRRAPQNVIIISDLQGKEAARFTIPRDMEAIAWGPDQGQLSILRRLPRTAVHFVDLNGKVSELVGSTRERLRIRQAPSGEIVVRYGADSAATDSAHDVATRSVVPFREQTAASPSGADCAPLVDIIRRDAVVDAFVCRVQRRFVLSGSAGERLAIPPDAIADLSLLARLDDTTLVGTTQSSVVTMTAGSRERRTLFTVSGARTITPDLTASVDGNWLAAMSSHADSQTMRFHLISLRGTTRREIDAVGITTSPPLWDPRGRFFVYTSEVDFRSDAWIETLSGDAPRRLTSAEPSGVQLCCAMARDGSGVAYTTVSGYEVSLWRVNIPPLTTSKKVP